jgi:Flp pilus assembly protein TadB
VTTPPERAGPDRLTGLSLGLLLAVALLLFAPLLGYRVPVWVIALLLAARLGVQLLRARSDARLRRPLSWVIDAALIALLLSRTV